MRKSSWTQITIPAVCCLALTAGALLLHAQTGISDLWVRFPDGTIQTTAAHNCVNPNDPDDEMIRVGGVCIDKYEASIWDAPTGGSQITGAIPCNENGQDCAGVIYARSVAGVQPRASITWFQAQAALANSGKRLPSNAEWQMAVLGTPDDTNCNVGLVSLANTGAQPGCVSAWGAFDMVGNLWEWVADWSDQAQSSVFCANAWPATYGDDDSCVGLGEGETNGHLPGAMHRGGGIASGTASRAGPFAIRGFEQPSASISNIGFRGAR